MFRIKLLWVGKTKETFVQEGILHYQKKLRPYLRLNCDEVHSSKHKKGGRNDSLREETQKILQRFQQWHLLYNPEPESTSYVLQKNTFSNKKSF